MDCPSPGISCFLLPFRKKTKGEAPGAEPGIRFSPSGKERPRTRKPPSGRRGLGLRGKQDETRPVRARRPAREIGPLKKAACQSALACRFFILSRFRGYATGRNTLAAAVCNGCPEHGREKRFPPPLRSIASEARKGRESLKNRFSSGKRQKTAAARNIPKRKMNAKSVSLPRKTLFKHSVRRKKPRQSPCSKVIKSKKSVDWTISSKNSTCNRALEGNWPDAVPGSPPDRKKNYARNWTGLKNCRFSGNKTLPRQPALKKSN